MDPIGLALENFDGAGQFRAQENGAPIDASGEMNGVAFKDASELGRALHDDPAATSCLVRRIYEYAAGRPPTKGDHDWVRYLEKSLAADNYRFPRIAAPDRHQRCLICCDARKGR